LTVGKTRKSGHSEDEDVMVCQVDGDEMAKYAAVEGMQVNTGIGMMAGVGSLSFEALVWSGSVRRGLMSRERCL